MKAIIFSAIFSPIMLMISYIVIGVISFEGGKDVLGLVISVGTLYAFIEYTIRFFEPIMQIARILAQFQQAQASAERVVQLIETKPDIYDSETVIEKYGDLLSPKMANWEPIKGDVTFDDVTFQYIDNEIILKDFNLSVKAGTSVALVGHTGSGKTTIINLLSRFYEPTEGEILIDGSTIKIEASTGYIKDWGMCFKRHTYSQALLWKISATVT